jgi:hypothetical protein
MKVWFNLYIFSELLCLLVVVRNLCSNFWIGDLEIIEDSIHEPR